MVLAAHINNTKRVTEEEVKAVPEPQFTKTWHPISHAKVINGIEGAVKDTGMDIVKKEYSLTSTGSNMFGVWTLDNKVDGKAWSIGIRNSLAKTFAVGICAGLYVFVCDNLVFSGDFVEFRKHTAGLDQDILQVIAVKAMGKVIKKLNGLCEWHDSLSNFKLGTDQFKALTFDAMIGDVFPISKFNDFLTCYNEENTISMESGKELDTLFTFHSAGTRLMRGASLFQVSKRNNALVTVIDRQIEAMNASNRVMTENKNIFQTLKEKFSGIRII